MGGGESCRPLFSFKLPARKGDFAFKPEGVLETKEQDMHIFKFYPDGKINLIQAMDGPGTRGPAGLAISWPQEKAALF